MISMKKDEKIIIDNIKKQPFRENHAYEIFLLMTGVLSKIIFTDLFFKKNIELEDFTKDILNKEYKQYLFKSRTLLYSRIIRDLHEEYTHDDKSIFLNNTKNISTFVLNQYDMEFEEKEPNVKRNPSKTNHTKESIKSWRNV